MKGEEPTARLVDALCDKVGREERATVNQVGVLKRIMQLGERHGTAVKPHVNEVRLAPHRLSLAAHEHDVVNIGAVQVDAVVVLLAVVAGGEALVAQRIARHQACGDGFINGLIKFGHRADAARLAVLGAPDGQRSAPIAAATQVPVVEVLQPLAKAARAGVLGLPQD